MSDFDRILEFLRRVARRRADRVEQTRYGLAHFTPSLPLVYYLNFVLVDAGAEAGAVELVADVDAVQGAAGLRHRKLAIQDDALGRALEPDLRALGFEPQPLLVLVYRGGAIAGEGARRATADELEPAWRETTLASGESRDDEEVRQLLGARALVARTVDTRYFAADAGGEVAASCELYSDGGIGQIESVDTLERYRNRGLGTAVVRAALAESQRLGNDLHFLEADDNDWPKEWYRRLGFEDAGRVWDFVRKPASEQPSAPPSATASR